MKSNSIYLGLLLATTLFGCNVHISRYDKLEATRWILGSWQNLSPQGITIEQWTQQNDSVFIGYSYFISGGDTLSSEMMRLEQQEDNLYFVPSVRGQNEGKPIVFVLTIDTENQVVFENPAHDFPQTIRYTQINTDSILAEISGAMGNEKRSIQFPLSRVK